MLNILHSLSNNGAQLNALVFCTYIRFISHILADLQLVRTATYLKPTSTPLKPFVCRAPTSRNLYAHLFKLSMVCLGYTFA